ncbi:MAG: type VI secretion system ATPase TssH [Deltaproteobacteria bacterium]|jgi:type VI secretion system protein VasG|nr:type VI secretion system ATPase TssH [Deltaproteobacteria bacterium]
MQGSDIRALISKLNTVSTRILYEAGGLSVSRTNYEVAVEHFLFKALEDKEIDIHLAAVRYGLDIPKLVQHLNQALENFTRGNTGRPTFSPVLLDLLESAWITASVDQGYPWIRTGSILIAYLKRPGIFSQGGTLPELSRIPREELERDFRDVTAGSREDAALEPKSGRETEEAAEAGAGGGFIAQFCEDFTAKAAGGKIDPVFGRDGEIRQMVNILARRRKNNPILVGEPGVGKTAVLEGLALRIVQGDVPDVIRNVTLVGLDMGLLQAGASMKGEFERRLKGVIDEIRSSPRPIILFIDEAHMLIGAGGAQGGADAANLLKPALARGELKTCAATTWKEYKKYFEKDAALARRFQLVTLEEPSIETAALILRGLRDSYELSHGVLVRDDALSSAAEMSGRYISGRFLPDKAVDLLDTACARVKVGLASKPAELEDLERSVQALDRVIGGMERDRDDGNDVDGEKLAGLRQEAVADREKAERVRASWLGQQAAARALIAARSEYLAALKAGTGTAAPSGAAGPGAGSGDGAGGEREAASPESGPAPGDRELPAAAAGSADPAAVPPPDPETLRKAFEEAKEAFARAGGEEPLLDVEVSPDVVAKVVSDWTGIPLGRIAAGQAGLMADLENRLGERIKGQEVALKAITKVIQASKAGLRDPSTPMGVFLLVGPSGVGKTETAMALASLLFGDEGSVVTINMSEFQEKFTVTRLVGSPPGLVGYGEGGVLTEAVRQRPYSVVLLDESEKASVDVMNLFYQVFDKGVLSDGEGKVISFRNTLIILTSNLATDIIESAARAVPPVTDDELLDAIRPTLNNHFKPALLARMTVVPYRALAAEALASITRIKLDALAARVRTNNGMELRYTDGLVDSVVSRCRDVETGARNIDAVLASGVMPPLAREILSLMSTGEKVRRTLSLGVDDGGDFTFDFS